MALFFCGLAFMAYLAPAYAQTILSCSSLAGTKIPASSIKLPTTGATIKSASLVAKTSTTPQYCAVLGYISPVDATAPKINFEVNLPSSWNAKAVQYGGGGYNGSLVDGLDSLTSAPPSVITPLANGYVTYGTDSGHQTSSSENQAAFALNSEALTNFAYAAYDKTRDVAVTIMTMAYRQGPAELYYFGHSEGGREALAMAQLFPDDFNGIVSVSPVISWTGLQTFGNSLGVAQQNSGWLNSSKVTTLADAVTNACDALDGLVDGIVSNYLACTSAVFNPSSLECSGGRNKGKEDNTCLSNAEIATVNAIHAGYSNFGFALANGITSYPGFLYGGESQQGAWPTVMMGTAAATFPTPSSIEGVVPSYGADGATYFFAQSSSYNPINFAPNDFQSQVSTISTLMDMTNPDLSAFYENGGKLIMMEGTADYAQSPVAGINYYLSVQSQMGQATTSQFMRLYISPGTTHSGVGSTSSGKYIPASVDLLGTLDAWVNGTSLPGNLIQVEESAKSPYTVTAARPLCQYPYYPKYLSGATNLATSYSCSE